MEPLKPSFFFIAGEPSGDEIGGRLIAALREATGGEMRIAGIGGEAMAAEGLESLFPIEELSVMGLVEVVPRAPGIMRRMSQTARAIRRLAPDAVVTIDAPAFANGVWRRLGEVDAALIHYVAPTVLGMARGPGPQAGPARSTICSPCFPSSRRISPRQGSIARSSATLSWKTGIATGDGASFRARHGISAGPVIGLLPGSRRGEICRLMPVFADAARRIAQAVPAIRAVIPAVPAHAALIREAAAELPVPVTVTAERGERHAAMAACDAAIAASGHGVARPRPRRRADGDRIQAQPADRNDPAPDDPRPLRDDRQPGA